MIIQKSRLKWLNDGDSNSKYFHRILKERRRRNHTGSIITKRGVVNSVREVKEAVKENFEDKFVENFLERPSLVGFDFNFLSMEDSHSLETPFLEEEIKEAVWSCDGSKSLGPDGMSLLFIKSCWNYIKKDAFAFLKYFHSGAVLSKSITSSFLTLILKVSNPLGLDDYRPICLGRQKIDEILVANELVDYAFKEGKECLLFKVDFEKAYDKVNWNFLRFMLRKLGFGDIWMKWMEALFLTTEGLKLLVNKAVSNGDYAGCNVNGRCFVDVLQLADDTLMVGDGS
ncbi:uncharacterized protein LOC131643129 [Vicia villosa]|uniref:uncharacterized protein LOC131643129 n=1 Tax=Vicia villosa TaxID=3911 RepID=UPI00273ACDFF|nr:uncharacterized protein LOC131643129 [Vicia villosa]